MLAKMDKEMLKSHFLESRRLALSDLPSSQRPKMTSFDDSLLLTRQRKFHKPNLRNQRLQTFKRSVIVTSIDENYADGCDREGEKVLNR